MYFIEFSESGNAIHMDVLAKERFPFLPHLKFKIYLNLIYTKSVYLLEESQSKFVSIIMKWDELSAKL